MQIHARAYQEPEDFERVRALLVETQGLNWTRHNWELVRWDRWRYQRADMDDFPAEAIRIWETDRGQMIGVAHPEKTAQVYLQIHPDYREIEPDMFAWAEMTLAEPAPIGQRTLETWVYEYDELRQMLLAQRRYRRQRPHRHHRWRSLRPPVQAPYLPTGYTLRTVENTAQDAAALVQLLADCMGADIAPEAYENFRRAPGYRADLDIVIIHEDGELVAHCSGSVDEANAVGQISAPCTHPDHRLRGLARASLFEVLRRLRQGGTRRAYVSCGEDGLTNRLYEKMGFRDFHREYLWRKQF